MAEAARKAETQEERKRPEPGLEVDLTPAESRGNIWHHDVRVPQDGITPEDLVDQGYWAHLANKLRPFDEIRAHAEDGSWFAIYLVRDVGTNWAKVHMLEKHRLDPITPETRRVMTGYSVQWKGNIRLWCIVREADKKIIKEGMKAESEAYAALAEFARQNQRQAT